MEKFYLTFGVNYGTTEIHPQGAQFNGDSVVCIKAQDVHEARAIAVALFSTNWSGIYHADTFEEDKHLYTQGVVMTIELREGTPYAGQSTPV